MYEVKWMPKTAAELEELCNKAVDHGFDLVACNDNFCVFKSAQHGVQRTRLESHIECKVFVKTEHGYECEVCGKPPSR